VQQCKAVLVWLLALASCSVKLKTASLHLSHGSGTVQPSRMQATGNAVDHPLDLRRLACVATLATVDTRKNVYQASFRRLRAACAGHTAQNPHCSETSSPV
jgi:hypothetical protein